jgi:hypothetical protein
MALDRQPKRLSIIVTLFIIFAVVLSPFTTAWALGSASYSAGLEFGKQYGVQIMQNISGLKQTATQRGLDIDRLLAYAKKTATLYQSILPEWKPMVRPGTASCSKSAIPMRYGWLR